MDKYRVRFQLTRKRLEKQVFTRGRTTWVSVSMVSEQIVYRIENYCGLGPRLHSHEVRRRTNPRGADPRSLDMPRYGAIFVARPGTEGPRDGPMV